MSEFEMHESIGLKKEFVIYLTTSVLIFLFLFQLLGNMKQTVAGTVFIALVIGTLLFWRFRVGIAFIGIFILLVTKTIDLKHTVEFMSLDVILLLIGMMVLVGLLKRSGFFRWLLSKGLKHTRFEPHRILWCSLVPMAIGTLVLIFIDFKL